MEVDSAVTLINQLIYKPGWTFFAEPHTPRFEGAVQVHVTYPALDSGSNSNPEAWQSGYTEEIEGGARANFPILVGDADDAETVYRRLLNCVLEIEEHEAREFLRVQPTGWAPFHPHRIEGMRRWAGSPDRRADQPLCHDLQFGLA